MKHFLLLMIAATLISCSNLSKNMVKEGKFTIKNGVYRNLKWEDELVLKRISWYHELTLLYEVMYGSISKESNFYNWFSVDEQRRLSKCKEVMLSINYSLDTDRISHLMFDSMLRNANFEKVLVKDFSKALSMHPDYKRLSLTLYKTQVYCKKSNQSDPIYINFPNYPELSL